MTDTLWTAVAETPLEAKGPTPSVLRQKLDREEQKKADEGLWDAIDADDVEGVTQALEKGARLEIPRKGLTPLLTAIWSDKVDMARVFLEAGANLNARHPRKFPVTQAALSKDSPDLADLLISHGVDFGKPVKYYGYGRERPLAELLGSSPRLVRWWLDKDFPLTHPDFSRKAGEHCPLPKDLPEWQANWARQATAHATRNLFGPIRDAMEKEAPGFSKTAAFQSFMTGVWSQTLFEDRASLIQTLAREGWTPDPMGGVLKEVTEYQQMLAPGRRNVPVFPAQKVCIAWQAVFRRSAKSLQLLLSSPGIRTLMQEDIRAHGAQLLYEALPVHVPTLTLLKDVGLDLKVQNKNGNLLHNRPHALTKVFAEWAIKNEPDLLFAENSEGVRAIDACKPEPALVAFVEKLAIKAAVGRAPRKSASTPVRTRRL
jgi:hypothetical protein